LGGSCRIRIIYRQVVVVSVLTGFFCFALVLNFGPFCVGQIFLGRILVRNLTRGGNSCYGTGGSGSLSELALWLIFRIEKLSFGFSRGGRRCAGGWGGGWCLWGVRGGRIYGLVDLAQFLRLRMTKIEQNGLRCVRQQARGWLGMRKSVVRVRVCVVGGVKGEGGWVCLGGEGCVGAWGRSIGHRRNVYVMVGHG